MTTSYEEAVSVVEQLSPVDQASLVVLLAERIQQRLQTTSSAVEDDAPAFWHLASDDVTALEAELPHMTDRQSAVPAQAETQAMVMRWFGTLLYEEDALELAMSAALAEWNIDE